MTELDISFTYEWKPFLLEDQKLSFNAYSNQGFKGSWPDTPTIYKWEGYFEKEGKTTFGCLIGETKDLRTRLSQYKTGTQTQGNLRWRQNFLSQGDIYLYTAYFSNLVVFGEKIENIGKALKSKALRLIVESLLVMEANNASEVQIENEDEDNISFCLINKNT